MTSRRAWLAAVFLQPIEHVERAVADQLVDGAAPVDLAPGHFDRLAALSLSAFIHCVNSLSTSLLTASNEQRLATVAGQEGSSRMAAPSALAAPGRSHTIGSASRDR